MARGEQESFFRQHPILANIIVIFLVAFLGLWIVYLSLQLFTKHGTEQKVPGVENMSYTQAINTLHAEGFRIDIRDSLYNDDFKPGYVIEQFPKAGSMVKPGRKIFLYINAVHPREVIIDVDNRPTELALKGFSYRQGMARLEELGFKNIKIVKVPGEDDRIIQLEANGKPVKKMEKTPVNALLTVKVSDGSMNRQNDSIQTLEMLEGIYGEDYPDFNYDSEGTSGSGENVEDLEPVYVQ